jgi:hypothetical protein
MTQTNTAKIGISMERLDQISQMTPTANTTISKLETFVEFSSKTLENLFNYASSFAIAPSQFQPQHASQTFVPISVLQNWYETFRRRLEANPYFWRT